MILAKFDPNLFDFGIFITNHFLFSFLFCIFHPKTNIFSRSILLTFLYFQDKIGFIKEIICNTNFRENIITDPKHHSSMKEVLLL